MLRLLVLLMLKDLLWLEKLISLSISRSCCSATKSYFRQTFKLIQFATEFAEQKRSTPSDLIESRINHHHTVTILVKILGISELMLFNLLISSK